MIVNKKQPHFMRFRQREIEVISLIKIISSSNPVQGNSNDCSK